MRAERLAFGNAAYGTRAVGRQAGGAFACGRFELTLAEYEHEWCGVEDRVVTARANADEQCKAEVLQRFSAECKQRNERNHAGGERIERTRHRLQDRRVDDLVVRLARHQLR